MKIPGIKRLRRSTTWLKSRFARRAMILGYHRIASLSQDPYRMCVSPENFAEHLEVLNRQTQVISLSMLEERIRTGQLPEKAVALTFDDGYVDFFQHARPLLEKYQLPATVFVVSGSLGCSFWWDRLEAAISTNTSLPDQLANKIARVALNLPLSEQSHGVLASRTPKSRDQLIRSIHGKLIHIDPESREELISEIENWTGSGMADDGEPLRSMTTEEVLFLARGGLIEIGSHSASHPWLSNLSPDEQRQEVSESKSILENILGRSVPGFSFPFGDVTQEAVSALKQAGFQYACSSANDVVRSSSDLFQLPRFWVPDWDGATFERWLRMWI